MDVHSVNTMLYRLLSSNEELRKVNWEIKFLIADDDLKEECAVVAHFRDEVSSLVQVKAVHRPPTVTSRQRQGARDKRDSSHGTGVKLLKLQLFHSPGELIQWQPFREQFDTAVNRNKSLPEADISLECLCSLLVGPAHSAISGLQATAAGYRDAVEMLNKRFGDKRRFECEHLRKMRSSRALSLSATSKDYETSMIR